MTIVVRSKRNDPNSVGEYIGRPSPLGNPYHIGADGSRARVIALYKAWLWDKIVSLDEEVLTELERLHDQHEKTGCLTLICWCAPKPCHGDIVRDALIWMKSRHFAESPYNRRGEAHYEI